MRTISKIVSNDHKLTVYSRPTSLFWRFCDIGFRGQWLQAFHVFAFAVLVDEGGGIDSGGHFAATGGWRVANKGGNRAMGVGKVHFASASSVVESSAFCAAEVEVILLCLKTVDSLHAQKPSSERHSTGNDITRFRAS